MTAKSVLMRPQGLHPGAHAPLAPLATPLVKNYANGSENSLAFLRLNQKPSCVRGLPRP